MLADLLGDRITVGEITPLDSALGHLQEGGCHAFAHGRQGDAFR
jgi:hypothetical protein